MAALTGREDYDPNHLRESGFDNVLIKPVTRQTLMDWLKFA